MIFFPHAKINIGLHVTNKRSDGYHDLYTLFFPIKTCADCLEIKKSSTFLWTEYQNKFSFPMQKNLIYKAWEIIEKKYKIDPVNISFKKFIPSGAGLGGGSSDAAFMLMGLNKLYDLNISNTEIMNYALELGSDVPFFILNKPAIAKGRGEILEEIEFPLKNKKIVLIKPKEKIPTKIAFQNIQLSTPKIDFKELKSIPIKEWKEVLSNDFELYSIKKIPEIGIIKNKMYESGAEFSLMTGSGSTVFGIFDDVSLQQLKIWALNNNFFYHESTQL